MPMQYGLPRSKCAPFSDILAVLSFGRLLVGKGLILIETYSNDACCSCPLVWCKFRVGSSDVRLHFQAAGSWVCIFQGTPLKIRMEPTKGCVPLGLVYMAAERKPRMVGVPKF